MIARIFAIVLLIVAVLAAGAEAVRWIQTDAYQPLQLGELWYRTHRASLNLLQAGVQRHLTPALWEWVFQPFLSLPVWVVAGLPGLLALWLSRPRSRAKFGSRRRG